MELSQNDAKILLVAIACAIEKETRALATIDNLPVGMHGRQEAARGREKLLREYQQLQSRLSRGILVQTYDAVSK